MSDRETLISMGFSEVQVTKALSATKNSGLSPALDFLEKHADEPANFWEKSEEADGHEEGDEEGAPGGGAEAKSLICQDCGKKFRNVALAEYHGTKSGHTNFEESQEEIAPLTEEEKAAKLAELKERMAEKKKINAKREAEEAKANEAIRRKGGKDQSAIKAELALKEANKEALQRKKDKIEDARAKAAVRAQIEADKKARADKAAREKALRDGTPLPGADASAPSAATTSAPAAAKSAASNTRLQIRLPNGGQPLVHAVESSVTLGEVKSWVLSQTGLSEATFSSAFPRKTYSADDDVKTMTELGLAPSAVLMLS